METIEWEDNEQEPVKQTKIRKEKQQNITTIIKLNNERNS